MIGDLLARWGIRFAVEEGVPCPLCAGTERAALRYETDQLAEHAVKAHNFEDVYDWTRQQYEQTPNGACVVGLLDSAFDTIQSLTTRYGRNAVDEWSWRCTRCGTKRDGFATRRLASLDRLLGHRCPL